MKRFILTAIVCFSITLSAQQVAELNYPVLKYPLKNFTRHCGFWIGNPDVDCNQYSVVVFRKTLTLSRKPDSMIVHISADNLYRLFINGKYVCMGPARNDLFHWNYETIDIAPFLSEGKNVITAQVNNFGHNKAHAQFSYKTGFMLVAHYPKDTLVNSDDKTWKTFVNKAYRERPVKWMYQIDIASGWYCINSNDSIIGKDYPWNWQNPDFDDSKWKLASWLGSPNIRYTGAHGPLLMENRTIQLLRHSVERLPAVARTENTAQKINPFTGKDSVVIPANSKVVILLDNKKMTMGFPVLTLSKGKGSSVVVRYAENLFDKDKMKGNRNDIKDKKMIGLYDVFLNDGGHKRTYQALWYRAFRFVQFEITTAGEPLVINDYYNIFTSYPFEEKASFACDDPSYKQMWDAGWRTDYICSQDFYMSDAYYETMQYFADTRIHGIVTAAITGDYSLYKQAIRQFNQSRIPDGLTLAAYPNDWYWVLPYFSLFWVDMVYDYTMITGEKELAKEVLPGVRSVLDWFERHINENGILGKLEWANPNGANENSTMFSLYYAYSLKNTARVCEYLGLSGEAAQYKEKATRITASVYRLSWDGSKNMLAETPDKKSHTQWGNIMGVLTDAIPQDKQKGLLQQVLTDSTLAHVGYIESFYLFEAIKKAGLGDLFDRELKPWRDQMAEGLTTFKEIPSDRARSETHPWSTCPLYYYFNIVCGIEATAPGFTAVKIEPALGKLKFIKGSMPVKLGIISVDLKRNGKTGIKGSVQIPQNMSGTFLWNNQSVILKGGSQQIDVK